MYKYMARPTPSEDWKFIKGEARKGVNWMREYFKDSGEDSSFDRKVALIEFGPFGVIRIILAIILAAIAFYILSAYASAGAGWILLVFILIALDYMFSAGYIIPYIVGAITFIFGFIVDIIKGTGTAVGETGISLGTDAGGFIMELFNDIVEIGKDIVAVAVDIIKDIFGMVGEVVRDIITAIIEMISDIFRGIGEAVRDILSFS